jgi:hypothetical protein
MNSNENLEKIHPIVVESLLTPIAVENPIGG